MEPTKTSLIFVFALLTIFENAPASSFEEISGYRGALWNSTYESVRKIVETTTHQKDCPDFRFSGVDGVSSILKEHSGLVGVSFSPDDLVDLPEFKKDLKYKPVDTGCGVFYRNKFIAYKMNFVEKFEIVKSTLNEKYGEPIRLTDKAMLYSRTKGKIFLIKHRDRPRGADALLLVYVSGDLETLRRGYKTATDAAEERREEISRKRNERLKAL